MGGLDLGEFNISVAFLPYFFICAIISQNCDSFEVN